MMRIPQRHRPLLAGCAALVLLYAAAAIRYREQHFASPLVLINLLESNAALGIIAVGMTFVILSGGIDLTVGAVMALSSVVVGVLIMQFQWHAGFAISAALLLGASFGAGMGGMICLTGIPPFIVTLAGMFLARGLGYLIQLEPIAIDDAAHAAFARARPAGLPLSAAIFLATVAGGIYLARFTRFGRRVYAIGGGEEAARLMGVRITATRIAVYGLSGLCASLAGVVLTLYLSSGSQLEGVGMELDAIAAVVVGGTLLRGGIGSVFGTLVGVLIIGIIDTVIKTYEGGFSSGFTKVVIGGLLLVFVVLQRSLSRGVN